MVSIFRLHALSFLFSGQTCGVFFEFSLHLSSSFKKTHSIVDAIILPFILLSNFSTRCIFQIGAQIRHLSLASYILRPLKTYGIRFASITGLMARNDKRGP